MEYRMSNDLGGFVHDEEKLEPKLRRELRDLADEMQSRFGLSSETISKIMGVDQQTFELIVGGKYRVAHKHIQCLQGAKVALKHSLEMGPASENYELFTDGDTYIRS